MESGFFHRWSGYYANASNARQEHRADQLRCWALLPDAAVGSLSSMLVLVVGGIPRHRGRHDDRQLVAFQTPDGHELPRPVGSMVGLGQTVQELQGDLARLDDVLAPRRDPSAVAQKQERGRRGRAQTRAKLRGHVELVGRDLRLQPGRPAADREPSTCPSSRASASRSSGAAARASRPSPSSCAGCTSPGSGEILLRRLRRATELPPTVLSELARRWSTRTCCCSAARCATT